MKSLGEYDLVLVDGNHMLHRIMHIPTFSNLRTKSGVVTGGVFGAISTLRTIFDNFTGIKRMVVVWDGGRSQRRLKTYPDYKQNRRLSDKATAEEAVEHEEYMTVWMDQQRKVVEMLPTLGIHQAKLAEREGDDVIAFLCNYPNSNRILVVSEDKDMYQLVTSNVHVYRPIQRQLVQPENFRQEVGSPRSLFLLMKAMLGDGTDNIKGIDGVSDTTVGRVIAIVDKLWRWHEPPKTAKEWEEVLGCLKVACEELAEVDTRNRHRYVALLENHETIERNLELVDMSREVFVIGERDFLLMQITNEHCFNEMDAVALCSKYEFVSFAKYWSRWALPFRGLR